MARIIAAIYVAAFGSVLGGAAALIGDAAGSPGIASWLTTGGSVSAAGALVYIVKKMTDGQLVARGPAEVEARLQAALDAANANTAAGVQREAELQRVIDRLMDQLSRRGSE